MARIWKQASATVQDRPLLQRLSDGGVKLELTGSDGVWIIVLTPDDCAAIAEAIGRGRPGLWPSPVDEECGAADELRAAREALREIEERAAADRGAEWCRDRARSFRLGRNL